MRSPSTSSCSPDMWAVGCIFAELLTLKPLFQGIEDKSSPNPFQVPFPLSLLHAFDRSLCWCLAR